MQHFSPRFALVLGLLATAGLVGCSDDPAPATDAGTDTGTATDTGGSTDGGASACYRE